MGPGTFRIIAANVKKGVKKTRIFFNLQLPPTLRLGSQWLLVVARVLLSGTPLLLSLKRSRRPAPVQLALENTERPKIL